MVLFDEQYCSIERNEKSDILVEYTPEMQAALEMDDEQKLFLLMREPGSNRHLAGYRLRPFKRDINDYNIQRLPFYRTNSITMLFQHLFWIF